MGLLNFRNSQMGTKYLLQKKKQHLNLKNQTKLNQTWLHTIHTDRQQKEDQKFTVEAFAGVMEMSTEEEEDGWRMEQCVSHEQISSQHFKLQNLLLRDREIKKCRINHTANSS